MAPIIDVTRIDLEARRNEILDELGLTTDEFNEVVLTRTLTSDEWDAKEELDAIQWDSLEEEMARSTEYDIVPDYDKLLDIMTAAKREASGG